MEPLRTAWAPALRNARGDDSLPLDGDESYCQVTGMQSITGSVIVPVNIHPEVARERLISRAPHTVMIKGSLQDPGELQVFSCTDYVVFSSGSVREVSPR